MSTSESNENEETRPGERCCDNDNEPLPQGTRKNIRNLVGFWLLGLCNNYGYVVMLSAAHDLLHPGFHGGDSAKNTSDTNGTNSSLHCNALSTGAILLADILPALSVKIFAPFIVISIHYKISVAVFLTSLSFILTSFSVSDWMTFVGVICGSFSSGLGEVSLLSYSAFFDRDVVSTWSSGTGGAGVIGAISYAVLTPFLGTRKSLLLMLVVPFIMGITFWCLIEHPLSPPSVSEIELRCSSPLCVCETTPMLQDNGEEKTNGGENFPKSSTFKGKLTLIKPLLKYMIPLFLVYFAEYFINQGLMELLYVPNSLKLTQADLYRWYQVLYQVGVLLSRSSVNLFHIHKLWILPILQIINMIFLGMEVRFAFVPSMWLILFIVFYEGLIGGWAYVNAFYKISTEVSPEEREFSMGITSLADSMGIALAGAVALKVHDVLCLIILSRPS